MSELNIYEGCYVELKNGRIYGPLRMTGGKQYCWSLGNKSGHAWNLDGQSGLGGNPEFRIIRVLSTAEVNAIKIAKNRKYGTIGNSDIPEHVLQAARDAGMRSVPTYDLFVHAVVEAAFEAAGNTVGIPPLRMKLHDEIHKTINRRLPDLDEQIAVVVVSKLASKVAMNALYGPLSRPENESAPEKAPPGKTEGGSKRPDRMLPRRHG